MKYLFLILTLTVSSTLAAETTLTIDVDKPGVKVSPMLYGIFFEEINRAGDGGLYAEMIQNRSFEDEAKQPVGWTGGMLDKSTPLNANNPTSLHIDGRVANEGFNGIAVEEGKEYRLSLYARGEGELIVSLAGAEQKIAGLGDAWKQFETTLRPTRTDTNAQLEITGKAWLDMVSLFPADAVSGLFRRDLFEMLKEMQPAFVRFPGGCFVEGDKLPEAVRWKKTIGDIAERPGHWNLWKYRSTDGLGYHEYLLLCEALGAEPLFVINAGMSHAEVRGKSPGPQGAELDEYVQDALDAIEYANGPVTSKWGALRAKAGHPAPFNLKYMEIGNENTHEFGPPMYQAHYKLFHDAIKAKYPEMILIANDWKDLPKDVPLDIVDVHAYTDPHGMRSMSTRFDNADHTGPKIYFGEYAVTGQAGRGNLQAAVAEAAFLTGLERNSDLVVMSSYAPLFEHVGYKRWNPNAILFNAAQSYATPSWHVQTVFGCNRADTVLPVIIDQATPAVEAVAGGIGVGTWATRAEFKDMKVTKAGKTLWEFDGTTNSLKTSRGKWEVADGVLRQASNESDARAVAGDKSWGDYTYALQARKLSGKEGFLIIFGQQGEEKSWWNIGGKGNTTSRIEAPEIADEQASLAVETGRWCAIRVELTGPRVRCYLDGKLIHDVQRIKLKPLYAVAGRKGETIILKVVNAGNTAQPVTIHLRGVHQRAQNGRAIVLTAASPTDENSFEAPAKVTPKEETITGIGASFQREFPANSVTILRIGR